MENPIEFIEKKSADILAAMKALAAALEDIPPAITDLAKLHNDLQAAQAALEELKK